MTNAKNTDFVRHPDRLFIGGEWVAASSAAAFEVVNCATERPFGKVAEAQQLDIDRAVAAARAAFDDGPWPRLSHAERASHLRAFAAEIRDRQDDLASIWSIESGATHATGFQTMAALAGFWEAYAGLAETYPFEREHPTAPGGAKIGILVQEPVGVVAAIIPWNGPAILITHKCAPALLAGCTVVLKASPEAPHTALVFAEIAAKVGLPAGVFNVVTADRAASELLVRHGDVDKVTFTGSTAAGKRVAAICGERMARCTTELGGKSPAVILDDFDLGRAAEAISQRARFLSGQVCSSLTRIILSRSRHDALVEALCASFGQLKVGDPFDPASQMGPLAMCRARERVEHYIAAGQAEGATLAAGGRRPAHLDQGFYVEPTVFGHVENGSTIGREEIFGPVLSVMPARDEADAVRIANDTVYGLAAAVFTDDPDRAYAVGRQLRAGSIGHNAQRTDFTIAFGGFKQSGIGREGLVDGIQAFLEPKTLLLDAYPSHLAGRPRPSANQN